MKVSIVTISYNQAQYLERALRSVIGQDYQDIEYIVVDPGSNDGSREIIERYRVKISKLIFEPDRGAADGLNRGFRMATGQVFGFLNSDDVLLPGAVSHIVKFFDTHPHVDVVSGHTVILDENDKKIRYSYSDRLSLNGYAYGAAVLMQPSTFFRAEAFRQCGGFNVSNKTNWDGELFIDMLLHGARFALTNKFLSGYRLQSNSITSSKKCDEAIREYHRRIFHKIKGRDQNGFDALISLWYLAMKYARNPRALYERMVKGAVYGRSVTQAGANR